MLSEYVKTDGVKNIGHGEVNLMVDSIGDNIEISRHVADVQAGVQAGDVNDTWVVRWLFKKNSQFNRFITTEYLLYNTRVEGASGK